MEDQVLSVEKMQELIELGIDTNKASMCWWEKMLNDYMLLINDSRNDSRNDISWVLPAFTLQDILEILQIHRVCLCYEDGWYAEKWNKETNLLDYCTEQYEKPIDAAFHMLKWCKENDYL